jgi:hypothetical protein
MSDRYKSAVKAPDAMFNVTGPVIPQEFKAPTAEAKVVKLVAPEPAGSTVYAPLKVAKQGVFTVNGPTHEVTWVALHESLTKKSYVVLGVKPDTVYGLVVEIVVAVAVVLFINPVGPHMILEPAGVCPKELAQVKVTEVGVDVEDKVGAGHVGTTFVTSTLSIMMS